YISCHTQGEEGYDFMYKLRRFYPLLRFVGKDGKRFGYRQTRLNEFQDRHGIDRTAKYRDITWYKGDQWFSITHDFSVYLLSRRKDIMKMFYLTNGPDEMFVQTIAMNSEFAERVKNDSLRKIDWRRGSPYEFTYNDLEELKGAKELFARKLSYEKEPELLKAVLDHWGRK
ncbi:MAG: beta-1,6-N-acetylglucosaminyltransferase, partial [Butyrivibrio sp.]|nr:beta-1,6-N-acetylglucosaminyltransferase [Butyrivibrio sp.]